MALYVGDALCTGHECVVAQLLVVWRKEADLGSAIRYVKMIQSYTKNHAQVMHRQPRKDKARATVKQRTLF